MSKVYLHEAAELLGTTYPALRARVHRMVNEQRPCDMPMPKRDTALRGAPYYWERKLFRMWLSRKRKLQEMQGGGHAV